MITVLLLVQALAHPDVDSHLHATTPTASCDDVQRLRRAAALSGATRFEEAQHELDQLCTPEADLARLALARLRLAQGRPDEAARVATTVSGLDAAVVRAEALSQLGRPADAGRVLGEALRRQPSAVPNHYLDAARWMSDAGAVEILDLGIASLGPIGSLVRAAARREAATGALDAALRRLDRSRLADATLAGDLLDAAGRHAEAQRAWREAAAAARTSRQTRARDELLAQLAHRLETP